MRHLLPMTTRFALLTAALATAVAPTLSLADCRDDAMLVFDGSTSMAEADFFNGRPPKLGEAVAALARSLPRVEPFRDLGLMVYGPGGRDGCSGVVLHQVPKPMGAASILSTLTNLAPAGLTPLTAAVERAANVVGGTATLETGGGATIILLTDGNETCGGRPCAASRELAAKAPDLTVHVIGFRMRAHDEYFRWNNPEQEFGTDNVARCFADATGGLYVTTQTIEELTNALLTTLGCPIIGRL